MMGDMMQISINKLNKFYGNKHALKDLNLTIGQGMFGLLGRNGAGKTTLMRILSTLLIKSSGDINICGIPINQSRKIRDMIGYLPQDFSMYPNMTVEESLEYLGILSGLKKVELRERIPLILKQVNLSDQKGTKIKALSGGMKQRLGIAQSILHNPKVLIIDEPTSGLDPMERIRFRKLLCELAKERIVIFSTHIISDVVTTCENIAILNEGSIIYNGTISELINETKTTNFEDAYVNLMEGSI